MRLRLLLIQAMPPTTQVLRMTMLLRAFSKTPASFEPSIDYVITKMPRFAFEKFPGSKAELSTMMKSVGETMAIGRTWIESFQKACRGLEIGLDGWALPKDWELLPPDQLRRKLRVPCPERYVVLKQAYDEGMSKEEIFELTNIDPWWLDNLQARSVASCRCVASGGAALQCIASHCIIFTSLQSLAGLCII